MTITLKYVQTVPRVDKAYELVMPLIVGPRYQPAAARAPAPSRADPEFGQWELQTLPDYPDVAGLTIPDTIDRDRVSIDVRLASGFDIKDVTSATHKVTVAGDDRSKKISLADGRTVGNRDFVLRYRLAGRTIEAGALTHRDERGGFFSLMIEPPEAAAVKDITPRELVFVLDTSGSMYGEPVEASKAFMRHALKMLRLNDSFRIVRFSNNATEFSSGPVPATPQNVSLGLSFVNQLSAGGGTEVPNAIQQAFDVPPNAGNPAHRGLSQRRLHRERGGGAGPDRLAHRQGADLRLRRRHRREPLPAGRDGAHGTRLRPLHRPDREVP